MKTTARKLISSLSLLAALTVQTASGFYDPTLQRWLTLDPIGEAGGINLYQLVGNDPLNKVDPWGHHEMFFEPPPKWRIQQGPDGSYSIYTPPDPMQDFWKNYLKAWYSQTLPMVAGEVGGAVAGRAISLVFRNCPSSTGIAAKTGTELMVHPFSGGGTHITTTARLAAYAESPTFGGSGGLFLAPTKQIDALLVSRATRSQIEIALGLKNGALSEGTLVRLDVANPFARNLSIPTRGNMFFRPRTGLTWGGLNEGLITSPLKTDPGVIARKIPGVK